MPDSADPSISDFMGYTPDPGAPHLHPQATTALIVRSLGLPRARMQREEEDMTKSNCIIFT